MQIAVAQLQAGVFRILMLLRNKKQLELLFLKKFYIFKRSLLKFCVFWWWFLLNRFMEHFDISQNLISCKTQQITHQQSIIRINLITWSPHALKLWFFLKRWNALLKMAFINIDWSMVQFTNFVISGVHWWHKWWNVTSHSRSIHVDFDHDTSLQLSKVGNTDFDAIHISYW